MGASKADNFTVEQNDLANIARVLGHPARIAILQHLLKVKACVCGSIVDKIPLAQPTVSQHLKELRNAGIIKGNIEGNAICYCINEVTWERNKKLLLQLFDSYIPNDKCC
jgi:ArsR family transcriptional regulator, arsenate/arsenite/antimonite-responsive transcriptional repressor